MLIKNLKKILILSSLVLVAAGSALYLSTPTTVLAQDADDSGVVKLENPLNLDEDKPVADLAGRVIRTFLGVVGIIALIMFVYGGVLWLVSAGNAERLQRGKDIFVWSIVGIVIIFSSYAIVSFILEKIIAGK